MNEKAPQFPQKVEALVSDAVEWLNTVQRNRTIAAILLLVQGMNFILNPSDALTGMVRSVAITVGIAALTSIIGCLAARNKGRAALRSGLVCVLLLAFCVYSYFRPSRMASSLRFVIATVAIGLGVNHLAQAAKMTRLQSAVETASARFSATFKRRKERNAGQAQDAIEKSVEDAVQTHVLKRLDPALKLSQRYSASRILTIVISAVMIAMGILLFLYPFQTDTLMMTLSGVTRVVGAFSEIVQGHLLRISSLRAAIREILPGNAA